MEDDESDNSASDRVSEDDGDDDASISDPMSEDNGDDDASISDPMSEDNGDDDASISDPMSEDNGDDNASTSDQTSDQTSGDSEGSDDSEKSEGGDVLKKLIVVKEDCVNHVGKRVMKYLLDLKKEKTRRTPVVRKTASSISSSTTNKGYTARQLLDDNKPWGGSAGRMTDQMMKKLSNSYGLAIRQGSQLASGTNNTLCQQMTTSYRKVV